MFFLDELQKLRFKMTPLPDVSGKPGEVEEKWTQWFLEKSFFRDFVYRNPRGKSKGEELADAVVLFDDVLIMAQVKARHSKRNAPNWTQKHLKAALRQLRGSRRALTQGHVPVLVNELYGQVKFDPSRYPHHIGIIVLAQKSTPFLPTELVPELNTAGFPVHVFSLEDFHRVVSRFDTAADLITFLEFRRDISESVKFLVHDELQNIERMLPHVRKVLKRHDPSVRPDVLERTCESFAQKARGELINSKDWRYGLAIDDIIAHSHDLDPTLPWNRKRNGHAVAAVATFLGWLSRDRRIKLGRRVVQAAATAKDGGDHCFCHFHPSTGRVFVFLATSRNRKERVRLIRFLLQVAQVKHRAPVGLGVATNPIGSGRSYDMALARKYPPVQLAQNLEKYTHLFADDDSL